MFRPTQGISEEAGQGAYLAVVEVAGHAVGVGPQQGGQQAEGGRRRGGFRLQGALWFGGKTTSAPLQAVGAYHCGGSRRAQGLISSAKGPSSRRHTQLSRLDRVRNEGAGLRQNFYMPGDDHKHLLTFRKTASWQNLANNALVFLLEQTLCWRATTPSACVNIGWGAGGHLCPL